MTTGVRKLTYLEAKRWVGEVEGEVPMSQSNEPERLDEERPDQASNEVGSREVPTPDTGHGSAPAVDSTWPPSDLVEAAAKAECESQCGSGRWDDSSEAAREWHRRYARTHLAFAAPVVAALRAELDAAVTDRDEAWRAGLSWRERYDEATERELEQRADLTSMRTAFERVTTSLEAQRDEAFASVEAPDSRLIAERDEARAEAAALRDMNEKLGEMVDEKRGHLLARTMEIAEWRDQLSSLLRGMARRASKLREEAQEAQWQHQGVVSYWRGSMETLRADLATAVSRAERAEAENADLFRECLALQESATAAAGRYEKRIEEQETRASVAEGRVVELEAERRDVLELLRDVDRANADDSDIPGLVNLLVQQLDFAQKQEKRLSKKLAARPSGFTLPDDADSDGLK